MISFTSSHIAGQGRATAYERDASMADVFRARVLETPSAIAVVAGDVSVSYAGLDERSNKIARHLVARGVRPGAIVGVAFERSIELPAVLLGILKAGAAYVALDPAYPLERLAFVVADADIEFVVTLDAGCDSPAFAPAQTICLTRDRTALEACSGDDPQIRCGARDLAYVAYTSGSTGTPKGVLIEQRGVVRLVRGADYFEVCSDDVFLHFAPLAFDASTFELWAPLLNGARLAIAPSGTLSFADLSAAIERFGVTTLWLTAALFRAMMASGLEAFRGLRQLITGGDVVPVAAAVECLRRFPECRLIDGYGPTENTTFSCCYTIASADAIAAGVPIGTPIANSSAYVVDGELWVGGDGLARGYLKRPDLTAERFVPDPFSADPTARLYRTGDRARVRGDGAIEFLGRLDHQVKIRGFRIEIEEIECALRAISGVSDAAVSVDDTAEDPSLVAHAVRARDSHLDERTLREALAAVLPRHMLPARIVFLTSLPLTASGKLDRAALRAKTTARAASTNVANIAPTFGPPIAQMKIRAAWCEVLNRASAPDVDENFFDAGGDSLRLLVLHDRLQRTLGIEIAVVDMFDRCTIRKLTDLVGGH